MFDRAMFLILATVGLLSSLGMIFSPNLVYAALWMIGFFLTVAGAFILLEADFLAIVQILITIGAVAVLILFVIMFQRPSGETSARPGRLVGSARAVVGGLAVISLAVVILQPLATSSGFNQIGGAAMKGHQRDARGGGEEGLEQVPISHLEATAIVEAVGRSLMTEHLLTFELVGLLLTAVLVGSIVLVSRTNSRVESHRNPRESRGGTSS